MVNLMGEMVKQYISIPPANETITPEYVGKMVIESMWVVSQWAETLILFIYTRDQLSGVFYLRVPPSLTRRICKRRSLPNCRRYSLV